MARGTDVSDGVDAARSVLPGVQLHAAERLRGGARSTVTRARAEQPGREPRSVVVKQFADAGEGWVREASALAVLPPGEASALLAAGGSPPVVVTEDLGAGGSLADVLLGDDPVAAGLGVERWARSLGRLHAAAHPLRERFRETLADRQGDTDAAEFAECAECLVSRELDDSVRALDAHCASLGVSIPTHALDDLRSLAGRLGAESCASISPVDSCPDNNVLVGDRYVLIDFEGAQWRHVAWDVAYLFVPWPTCWCSWRLPDDVARRGLSAYHDAARGALPQVDDDAFARDVEAAATAWALTSTASFLDDALGGDPDDRAGRPAPARRAVISNRLALAATLGELPAAAELAGALLDELRGRWGDVPLDVAPAFRRA